MRTLIIIGNDKIGRSAAKCLSNNTSHKIVLDNSTSFWRVVKILRKGGLKWSDLFKMSFANLGRKSTFIDNIYCVQNNAEIEAIIKNDSITRILLFRAGIIINKRLLNNKDVEFINVHCARIPEYGGLGSIPKALREKAYAQVATLHRVVEKIDDGEVLRTMPYSLFSYRSFRENEDEAYLAGQKLLLAFLTEEKEC